MKTEKNKNPSKEKKFKYKLVHPYLEKINPKKDFVDIEVEFKGEKYRGSVTTTRFIGERLKYYKKTEENAEGSYFYAKGMIILREINDRTIRRTLEDLIERENLQEVFLD